MPAPARQAGLSARRPLCCSDKHANGDGRLGEPFCEDCYDYEAAVLFNYRASELWNRFCRAFRRQLAGQLGMTTRQLGTAVRVSFVKVGEMQRRAVIHFHAIIRLDRPGAGWHRPAIEVTFGQIETAAKAAAAQVNLRVEGSYGDVNLRWGEEIDVQPIRHQERLSDRDITPEVLSAYLSKYTCKSAGEPFGLDGKVREPEAARTLGASRHLVRMMQAAIDLSARPALEGLTRWVQTLGFPGHFTSKSRQWSVTLGELRAERVHHCLNKAGDAARGEATTLLYGEWRFRGVGWQTAGEGALVRYALADAIEARQFALGERWYESRDGRSCGPTLAA